MSIFATAASEHAAQVIHRKTTPNIEFIALLVSVLPSTLLTGINVVKLLLNLPSPKKTESISTLRFLSPFQTKIPYYIISAMNSSWSSLFPFLYAKRTDILSCSNNSKIYQKETIPFLTTLGITLISQLFAKT